MILQDTYTLANGVAVPKIGLGTWMIEDDKVADAVKTAVDMGYRHIDTAQAYENERGVGEGVRTASVPREELFVTTKLDAGIKNYDDAKAAIDGSLEKMGLDYIDLMIIHSPQPWQNFGDDDRFFEGNVAAWKALEEAYEAGKLKAIGVSNFNQADLQNLIDNATVKPMLDQILTHISNTPFELIDFIQSNDMVAEAYSPVGHGEIIKRDDIKAMAEKYGVTVPQLAIRYVLQLGMLPLPKTANPDHMKNNADVDFVISDEDMDALKSVKQIEDYGDHSFFPVFGGKM
ncbi:MAG: aldo/keto reductase [Pseudomonadota bacterium]|nr:aldo/keto reductase [Pseudomonadota bacterium]